MRRKSRTKAARRPAARAEDGGKEGNLGEAEGELREKGVKEDEAQGESWDKKEEKENVEAIPAQKAEGELRDKEEKGGNVGAIPDEEAEGESWEKKGEKESVEAILVEEAEGESWEKNGGVEENVEATPVEQAEGESWEADGGVEENVETIPVGEGEGESWENEEVEENIEATPVEQAEGESWETDGGVEENVETIPVGEGEGESWKNEEVEENIEATPVEQAEGESWETDGGVEENVEATPVEQAEGESWDRELDEEKIEATPVEQADSESWENGGVKENVEAIPVEQAEGESWDKEGEEENFKAIPVGDVEGESWNKEGEGEYGEAIPVGDVKGESWDKEGEGEYDEAIPVGDVEGESWENGEVEENIEATPVEQVEGESWHKEEVEENVEAIPVKQAEGESWDKERDGENFEAIPVEQAEGESCNKEGEGGNGEAISVGKTVGKPGENGGEEENFEATQVEEAKDESWRKEEDGENVEAISVEQANGESWDKGEEGESAEVVEASEKRVQEKRQREWAEATSIEETEGGKCWKKEEQGDGVEAIPVEDVENESWEEETQGESAEVWELSHEPKCVFPRKEIDGEAWKKEEQEESTGVISIEEPADTDYWEKDKQCERVEVSAVIEEYDTVNVREKADGDCAGEIPVESAECADLWEKEESQPQSEMDVMNEEAESGTLAEEAEAPESADIRAAEMEAEKCDVWERHEGHEGADVSATNEEHVHGDSWKEEAEYASVGPACHATQSQFQEREAVNEGAKVFAAVPRAGSTDSQEQNKKRSDVERVPDHMRPESGKFGKDAVGLKNVEVCVLVQEAESSELRAKADTSDSLDVGARRKAPENSEYVSDEEDKKCYPKSASAESVKEKKRLRPHDSTEDECKRPGPSDYSEGTDKTKRPRVASGSPNGDTFKDARACDDMADADVDVYARGEAAPECQGQCPRASGTDEGAVLRGNSAQMATEDKRINAREADSGESTRVLHERIAHLTHVNTKLEQHRDALREECEHAKEQLCAQRDGMAVKMGGEKSALRAALEKEHENEWLSKKAELETRVEKARAQMEACQAENLEYATRLSTLEREKDERSRVCDDATREVEVMQGRCGELQSRVQALEDEAAQAQSNYRATMEAAEQTLKAEVEERFKAQVEDMQRTMTQRQAEFAARMEQKEREVEAFSVAREEWERQRAVLEAENQSTIAELQQKHARAREEWQGEKDTLAAKLENQILTAKGELETQKNQLQRENEEKVVAIREEMACMIRAAQQQAEEMIAKTNAAQQQAEQMIAKANAAQQQVEKMTAKADAAHQRAEDMTAKADAAQQEAEQMIAKANAAHQRAEDMTAKADAAQQEAEQIITKANAAQQQVEKMTAKADAAHHQVEEMTTRADAAQQHVEEMTAKVNAAHQQVEDMTAKADAARQRADEMEAKVNASEHWSGTEKEQLTTEFTTTRDTLQAHITHLESENAKLQETMRHKCDELAATEKNHDAFSQDLKAESDRAKKQLEELRQKLIASQEKVAEQACTITKMRAEIQKTTDEMHTRLETQVAAAQHEVHERHKQELDAEKKGHQSTIAHLEHVLEDTERKNAELTTKLQELTTEYSNLKSDVFTRLPRSNSSSLQHAKAKANVSSAPTGADIGVEDIVNAAKAQMVEEIRTWKLRRDMLRKERDDWRSQAMALEEKEKVASAERVALHDKIAQLERRLVDAVDTAASLNLCNKLKQGVDESGSVMMHRVQNLGQHVLADFRFHLGQLVDTLGAVPDYTNMPEHGAESLEHLPCFEMPIVEDDVYQTGYLRDSVQKLLDNLATLRAREPGVFGEQYIDADALERMLTEVTTQFTHNEFGEENAHLEHALSTWGTLLDHVATEWATLNTFLKTAESDMQKPKQDIAELSRQISTTRNPWELEEQRNAMTDQLLRLYVEKKKTLCEAKARWQHFGGNVAETPEEVKNIDTLKRNRRNSVDIACEKECYAQKKHDSIASWMEQQKNAFREEEKEVAEHTEQDVNARFRVCVEAFMTALKQLRDSFAHITANEKAAALRQHIFQRKTDQTNIALAAWKDEEKRQRENGATLMRQAEVLELALTVFDKAKEGAERKAEHVRTILLSHEQMQNQLQFSALHEQCILDLERQKTKYQLAWTKSWDIFQWLEKDLDRLSCAHLSQEEFKEKEAEFIQVGKDVETQAQKVRKLDKQLEELKSMNMDQTDVCDVSGHGDEVESAKAHVESFFFTREAGKMVLHVPAPDSIFFDTHSHDSGSSRSRPALKRMLTPQSPDSNSKKKRR